MKVSDAGLQFIAQWEGFSGTLYNDPSGNCTVGYGYLVHIGVCNGAPSENPYKAGISESQGRTLLAETILRYADAVNRYTVVPLNQNQFDALVSFTYNVGIGGYATSSVCQVLNAGHYDLVYGELQKYTHGNDGAVYPGLERRRQAEGQLFNTEEDGLTQAQYDEIKADIGQVLQQLGNLGKKIDDMQNFQKLTIPPLAEGKNQEVVDLLKQLGYQF